MVLKEHEDEKEWLTILLEVVLVTSILFISILQIFSNCYYGIKEIRNQIWKPNGNKRMTKQQRDKQKALAIRRKEIDELREKEQLLLDATINTRTALNNSTISVVGGIYFATPIKPKTRHNMESIDIADPSDVYLTMGEKSIPMDEGNPDKIDQQSMSFQDEAEPSSSAPELLESCSVPEPESSQEEEGSEDCESSPSSSEEESKETSKRYSSINPDSSVMQGTLVTDITPSQSIRLEESDSFPESSLE